MLRVRASIAHTLKNVGLALQILIAANSAVHQLQEGIVCTLIVAIVDTKRKIMVLANAGHPPPLLISRYSHKFLRQEQANLPLGVFPEYKAHLQLVHFPADALIIFYTDGVTEHDLDGIAGEAELVEAGRYAHAHSEENAAEYVWTSLLEHLRGTDDAAIMCVRTSMN